MRFFNRFLLFLAITVTGVTVLGYYWTFVRLSPIYEHEISLSGLENQALVLRDAWGVPDITATSEADAFRALGWIHAEDRLWQMTVSQLTVDGRFSEFFGADLLPVDRFLRTLDFAAIAKENALLLPKDELSLLRHYAEGVNAWVSANQKRLPIEFALAGINPIPWEPHHSLGIARLMAWQLNVTWNAELAYAFLQQTLTEEQFALLAPENWPNRFVSSTTAPTRESLLSMLEVATSVRNNLNIGGAHTGSNAWAVSGKKTRSGKPLLAGDPHLALSVPGTWFEVSIHTTTMNLSGVSIPGVPGIILGQNDVFGWSFTNVMADDADFFIEKTHPTDSTRYLASASESDTVWASFDYRAHYIRVKDKEPQLFLVKRTQNGPVVNQIAGTKGIAAKPVVTYNWTGLHPSREMSALLGMNRARNRAEFEQSLQHFKTPSQNVVFADTSGFIARWTIGRIPKTNPAQPIFKHGWDDNHRWNAFLEMPDFPHDINPADGIVLSANNQIGSGIPYLSRYWEPPSRFLRLNELLKADKKFEPDDFRLIAGDVYSHHAEMILREVLPVFKAHPENAAVARTLNYLENWDYTYSGKSAAAGIFDMFFLTLAHTVLEDDMGPVLFSLFTDLENIPVRSMHEILRQDSLFFDHRNTPEVETKEQVILKSLETAVAELDKRFGKEPYQWQWDNVHTVTLSPLVFGKAAEDPKAPAALKLIVRAFFNIGPNASPGHGMTLNNAQYNWDRPFQQVLGPSVRRIIDLSNTGSSHSILPAGQSGNPFSIHYSDQHERWLKAQNRIFKHRLTPFEAKYSQRFIPVK